MPKQGVRLEKNFVLYWREVVEGKVDFVKGWCRRRGKG